MPRHGRGDDGGGKGEDGIKLNSMDKINMRKSILYLILFYQKTSFFHKALFRNLFLTDAVCKYEPTCSNYTYQAVEKYGVFKGLFLGFKRIIRCHPWAKGGLDPV